MAARRRESEVPGLGIVVDRAWLFGGSMEFTVVVSRHKLVTGPVGSGSGTRVRTLSWRSH